MVRVAGLHDQIDAGIEKPLQDGRTPSETIDAHPRARARAGRPPVALPGPRPAARAGRARASGSSATTRSTAASGASLDERFRRQIFPVLTPLAVGLGRPFPYISNLSLSLGVMVRDPITEVETFARVKVPKEMLPRFVAGRRRAHVRDARGADRREPRLAVPGHGDPRPRVFRVTRDADFTVSDEADDLLQAVEEELRARRFGEAVRVEVGAGMSERDARADHARAGGRARGRLRGRRACSTSTTSGTSSRSPATPSCATRRGRRVTQPLLQPDEDEQPDVLGAMRKRDILLHHPYDSFVSSVERFVEQAVNDPGRARDQADRVPHERRLAAGARR